VIGAVDEQADAGQLTPVAHDASGPSAIDWALANPGRVARLVLLNNYYHLTPPLRRPPARRRAVLHAGRPAAARPGPAVVCLAGRPVADP
jgi:pimeloyl-ACP methyl ester carboxylesterase